MTYHELSYLHLGSIIPAFTIGTFLLIKQKGSPTHRLLGKIYMILMLLTAITTLFMQARVGPTILNHFGFIHLFSISVFILVPSAYFAALNGKTAKHKGNMLGLYVGGILIAGSFALAPGRLIHAWIFGVA